MQIYQLLRESVLRFSQAETDVCIEWSDAVTADGICSPCDRTEFSRLVKIKIAAIDRESMTTVHAINKINPVHKKFSAREAS